MWTVAPAKINWTLEVLGRRSDAYHEVKTILQAIDLCDELYVEPAESLIVRGSPAAREDDLIGRAARALANFAGREPHASIRIEKSIPVGAGLGGGSADAAATLRALNRMWKLDLSTETLAGIARDLGADVPFFLLGGMALGEGRGDQTIPLPDAPPAWLVLLVPAIRLPYKTRRMYEALTAHDYSDGSRTDVLSTALRRGHILSHKMFYNAFEAVAYEAFRDLARHRDGLMSAGARAVHLAGSGPTLFAVVSDERNAIEMRDRLGATEAKAYAVRTLTARESTLTVD